MDLYVGPQSAAVASEHNGGRRRPGRRTLAAAPRHAVPTTYLTNDRWTPRPRCLPEHSRQSSEPADGRTRPCHGRSARHLVRRTNGWRAAPPPPRAGLFQLWAAATTARAATIRSAPPPRRGSLARHATLALERWHGARSERSGGGGGGGTCQATGAPAAAPPVHRCSCGHTTTADRGIEQPDFAAARRRPAVCSTDDHGRPAPAAGGRHARRARGRPRFVLMGGRDKCTRGTARGRAPTEGGTARAETKKSVPRLQVGGYRLP